MKNHEIHDPDTREIRQERRTALTLLIVLAILFGGVLATAYAAERARPGDALYPIKSSVENTRLRLAVNAIAEGEIHLELAERRLDELSGIIAAGNYDQVSSLAVEFETHVQKAIDNYEAGASGDPIKAQELALKTAAALSRYTQTLAALHANAPEEARSALNQAMLAAQGKTSDNIIINTEIVFKGFIEGTTVAAWTVGGRTIALVEETQMNGAFQVGDPVEVRAMVSPDGSLTAMTIQPTEGLAPQTEVEIIGTVDAMEAKTITIDTLIVALTSQTRIKGALQHGSTVKVQAMQDANGSLIAVTIELAGGSGQLTSTPRPTTLPRTAVPTPSPQPPGETSLPATPTSEPTGTALPLPSLTPEPPTPTLEPTTAAP